MTGGIVQRKHNTEVRKRETENDESDSDAEMSDSNNKSFNK